jgi:hypothetical protein
MMKAKVSKKWWQFWLPSELEVSIPGFEPTMVIDPSYLQSTPKGPNPFPDIANETSAIEADEAEPWYGGDAVEDEDSSVVTAEPPVVYANRGNARMEERKQARERQQ